MKNILFITCIFFSVQISAQKNEDTIFIKWLQKNLASGQNKKDSLLAKKYFSDTSHFIFYPAIVLPDSLILDKTIAYWEINVCSGSQCHNTYRSGNGKKSSVHENSWNDTLVLSKAGGGFGTICPPGYCSWYISARLKNGTIKTIVNFPELGSFIGTIDNPFDAYFWLSQFGHADSRSLPLHISTGSKYRIVPGGYLVVVNLRVNDCPVTMADIVYFVGKDRDVTFIRLLKVTAQGGCI